MTEKFLTYYSSHINGETATTYQECMKLAVLDLMKEYSANDVYTYFQQINYPEVSSIVKELYPEVRAKEIGNRIWKYEIDNRYKLKVKRWLSAENQNGVISAWAVIDNEEPERDWYIGRIGTGWEFRNNEPLYMKLLREGQFLNTVIDDFGYVWHVFAMPIEE